MSKFKKAPLEDRRREKKKLLTGNEAIGEAALCAECVFYAGYPITPQNELTAFMAKKLPQKGGVFIQAESELAAINMVFGASASGARAMTSSSSPGISLKQEGISYLAGCQLPAVIVNVMRAGPGLGNISPSQSDYFQATKGGGHGDYKLIVLAPFSVQECFDLTFLAFDLADKYRNPVIILVDAFLAQMAEPVEISFSPSFSKKKNWALQGAKKRPPNIIRSLFLKEGALEGLNLSLQKKYRVIKKREERFSWEADSHHQIIFVAYGISFRIAKETAVLLGKKGVKVGLFRPITLWPYPYQALREISKDKKAVFVFELSYGQMLEDVRLTLGGDIPLYFYGRGGGGVFSSLELERFVREKLDKL